MNKYFTSENGQHIGPFSIDELKSKNISNTELVWAEGMSDWQQAGTIDELKYIFTVTPPPPPSQTTPPPIPPSQVAPPIPPSQVAPPPPAPPSPPSTPRPQQANYTHQAQFNTGGYIPKPGGSWIIAGYIFSVVGGFLGWVIGTHLKFSKEKLPNGTKVKKFDEKSQQHGLILIIIGGISWIIWLALMN